jgi:hypothetical protein
MLSQNNFKKFSSKIGEVWKELKNLVRNREVRGRGRGGAVGGVAGAWGAVEGVGGAIGGVGGELGPVGGVGGP